MLVSILMPAYNASKYIGDAIESVIRQSYSNWELIIVDDLSSDNTFIIASKYAKKDRRIKSLQLLENSGSAQKPRLIAEQVSKGDFVCLLDADDIIDEHYIKRLVIRQKETNADIVLGRICGLTEGGEKLSVWNPVESISLDCIMTGKEAFSHTIGSWDIGGLGLFSREIVDKARTKISWSHHFMNADEIYTRLKMLSSESVAFAYADYYYRYNSESITKRLSIKAFDSLETGCIINSITEKYFGSNSYEYYKSTKSLFDTIYGLSVIYQNNINSFTTTERKDILNRIKHAWDELSFLPLFRFSISCAIKYCFGIDILFVLIKLRNHVKRKYSI